MSSPFTLNRLSALRPLIAALATVLCLAGLVALDSHPAQAATRAQIVAIANAEVGASEANGNCTKYGPCTTQEWCAYFAKWVWKAAGVSPVFTTAVARGVGQWGVNNGLFSARPAGGIGSPQPGDVVVYGTPANVTGGHVSIVASVNGNGTIDTIDGNWNEQVQRRTINPVTAKGGGSNLLISGYVRPPGVSSGGGSGGGNDVSDFSGDGYSDVLGVNDKGKLYYYPNHGLKLGAHSELGNGGWQDFKFAAAADWSGDKHADILAVDAAGQLFYYPNHGNNVNTRTPLGNGGWLPYKFIL